MLEICAVFAGKRLSPTRRRGSAIGLVLALALPTFGPLGCHNDDGLKAVDANQPLHALPPVPDRPSHGSATASPKPPETTFPPLGVDQDGGETDPGDGGAPKIDQGSAPARADAGADPETTARPDAAPDANSSDLSRPDSTLAETNRPETASPDTTLPPPSAALADGLLLFFPFDQQNGPWTDHSGHNASVSLQDFGASEPSVAGRWGEALASGRGDPGGNLRVETSNSLNGISGALTISAWVRPGALSDRDGVILSRFSSAQNGYGYALRLSRTRLQGLVNDTNAYRAEVSTPVAPLRDGWTHVAMTYDSKMLRLYVDGKPTATAAYQLGVPPDLTPVFVGAGGAADKLGDRLAADLDDVALYSRALSANDIAALARGVRPLVH